MHGGKSSLLPGIWGGILRLGYYKGQEQFLEKSCMTLRRIARGFHLYRSLWLGWLNRQHNEKEFLAWSLRSVAAKKVTGVDG